jgi:lysophospholipase L1-like esterase
LFSVSVPEGNWRVTVTLGDAHAPTDTTIKAESRRLMLDAVRTRPGQLVTRSFVVAVRTPALAPVPQNAPGGNAVRLNPREAGSLDWDGKLTLEVLGEHPGLAAVAMERADVPTLFLLGDSTVTDQRFEPAASWGQMLPTFLRPDIAVANHAESGETLKSFIAELRLAKVLETAKAGDWAMIQFGHNDQKASWPQTFAAADTTYRSWLAAVVADLRRVGVRPILVTPPERRNWTADGRIRPTLSDYAAAIRAVGAESHVPVIDLNAASIAFYEALGPTRAPIAFNDGGKDATHHDNYGAWVLARAVASGMGAADPALAAHLRPDLASFDPAHPPMPEALRLAASAGTDPTRPRGN